MYEHSVGAAASHGARGRLRLLLVVVVGVGVVELGLGPPLLVEEYDGAEHHDLRADAEEGPERVVHALDPERDVGGRAPGRAALVQAGVGALRVLQHQHGVVQALLVLLQLHATAQHRAHVRAVVQLVLLVLPRHLRVRLADQLASDLNVLSLDHVGVLGHLGVHVSRDHPGFDMSRLVLEAARVVAVVVLVTAALDLEGEPLVLELVPLLEAGHLAERHAVLLPYDLKRIQWHGESAIQIERASNDVLQGLIIDQFLGGLGDRSNR